MQTSTESLPRKKAPATHEFLADVNVLFALVNQRHAFHLSATRWFDRQPPGFKLFVCRIVQMGLLRLLTNQAAMDGAPLTLPEAWKLYGQLMGTPSLSFIQETESFLGHWVHFCTPYGASPKILTDAYLAALAVSSGLTLVSFDRDFANFSRLTLELLY